MASAADQTLLPWVEKYRPRTLDDVKHQDDVVKSLKRSLETNELPHLLFYGPPGTGKTSTILAAARQLYGPVLLKSRVKELNASDERGIDVVRTKIKEFAQVAVGHDTTPGYPCPPFKIIILDECDSMTHDAQSALRRVIENHSKVTRFCLICNYVTRIIEPIASRCAKFRFKLLNQHSITRRISHICESERIAISDEAVRVLQDLSNGDLRTAINLLQSAQMLHEPHDPVTPETIMEIAGSVPDAVTISLLKATVPSVGIPAIEAAVRDAVASGYPAGKILEKFQVAIENEVTLSDDCKAQICLRIGDMDQALVEGADEYLQLLSLLIYTSKIRLSQRHL